MQDGCPHCGDSILKCSVIKNVKSKHPAYFVRIFRCGGCGGYFTVSFYGDEWDINPEDSYEEALEEAKLTVKVMNDTIKKMREYEDEV